MYQYKADIIRVVDGDTVIADVELGFRVIVKQIFRLYGINTPEVVGIEKASGLASKAHLSELLTQFGFQGWTAETYKNPTDKYGRYLVTFMKYIPGLDENLNINEKMVTDGFAVKATY